MSLAKRFITYLQESHKELKKVVWPSQKEVIQHTTLVIVISLGVAAFLGIADYLLNIIVDIII